MLAEKKQKNVCYFYKNKNALYRSTQAKQIKLLSHLVSKGTEK